MKNYITLVSLVLAGSLIVLLSGCNSSGTSGSSIVNAPSSGRGQINFTFTDDSGSRVLPPGTGSISVTLTLVTSGGDPVLAPSAFTSTSYLNTASSGTLSFPNVPVGYYAITASAWSAASSGANPVLNAPFTGNSSNILGYGTCPTQPVPVTQNVALNGNIYSYVGYNKTITVNIKLGSIVSIAYSVPNLQHLHPGANFLVGLNSIDFTYTSPAPVTDYTATVNSPSGAYSVTVLPGTLPLTAYSVVGDTIMIKNSAPLGKTFTYRVKYNNYLSAISQVITTY
jgi:hypothetical protein